jgi:hypothetical protein
VEHATTSEIPNREKIFRLLKELTRMGVGESRREGERR